MKRSISPLALTFLIAQPLGCTTEAPDLGAGSGGGSESGTDGEDETAGETDVAALFAPEA